MNLLVTVGTTKFDELIDLVSKRSFLDFIWELGYQKITIQHGKSLFSGDHDLLKINSFDYTPSLQEYYTEADTVISSGGSGTILECLELNKDFIVVLNTTLQDNHQTELSQKLSEQGYLTFVHVQDLQIRLKEKRQLKPWVPIQNSIVPAIILQYLS